MCLTCHLSLRATYFFKFLFTNKLGMCLSLFLTLSCLSNVCLFGPWALNNPLGLILVQNQVFLPLIGCLYNPLPFHFSHWLTQHFSPSTSHTTYLEFRVYQMQSDKADILLLFQYNFKLPKEVNLLVHWLEN